MSLPKEIAAFKDAYGIESDDMWEVRTGSGAWAIKHKALERVAAQKNISFEQPNIIESSAAEKVAVICVTGKLGDRYEWSIGEASPANNKNSYCYAMAEKRAKDRVILKLLNVHGSLYSEEEADDFKQRQNPHVTRPSDILPEVEYDEQGHPIDNIPRGDDRIERLPKAKARADFAVAQHELRLTKTPAELAAWGKKNANRVESYPADWQEMLRGIFIEHRDDLRKSNQEAA